MQGDLLARCVLFRIAMEDEPVICGLLGTVPGKTLDELCQYLDIK